MVWLKRVVTALVLLVVILLIVGLFLPRDVQVERTITITAPPQQVYAEVVDLKHFNHWSPWFGIDPATRYVLAGKLGQPGQQLSWQSDNPSVGKGSMTLVESNAPGYVAFKLDFGPQGQADSYFRIRKDGKQSEVTWGFRTNFGNDIAGRYFGLMMDSVLGKDFEKGLASLKKTVEEGENKPDDNG